MYAAGNAGASVALNFNEAVAYGSILAATDALAMGSIMENAGLLDPHLHALVMGEGSMNDAVSAVLYQTFSGFYLDGVSSDSLTGTGYLFITELFGSFFLGVLSAVIGAGGLEVMCS